jgi:hypothetical protein
MKKVEKDLSKESLIVIPGTRSIIKPEEKTTPEAEKESVMPVNDVAILEEIKRDMYVMGKTYVSAFNIVSGITAVRAANMSYRCAMQAIRDKIRFLIPKA